jgi:hypothetical protein
MRTNRCDVATFGHAYNMRVCSALGSTSSSNREVSESTSCRIAVSLPSALAPSVTRCIVSGRCPTSENICGRVNTSLTGRSSNLAAIVARMTCDHGDPLQPKPPPTK